MPTLTGNRDIWEAALVGLEAQRAKLDEQIAVVRSALRGGNRATAAKPESARGRGKRRRMSAEGRKRIAEAARKRWAAYNAQKQAGGRKKAAGSKRTGG